jgi:hypothetical protein
MLVRVIVALIVLEAALFALAAALHALPSIAEQRGLPEAMVQAAVAVLLAIAACALWRRKAWATAIVLGVHGLAVLGFVFGLAVTLLAHRAIALHLHDLARLVLFVVVPGLLLTPAARRQLRA